MTVPNRMHISWQNDIGEYTLASDGTPETAYPLTNLQNGNANQPTVFDMTADTALALTGSSATERTATCFSLHNHNMPSDNEVRLRLYAGESQAGKLTRDTGETSFALDSSTKYMTVPDSAGNSVVGAMDFYARVNPTDKTPASNEYYITKWTTSGAQKAWGLGLDTTGVLQIILSTDGSTTTTTLADSAPTWSTDMVSIKASWDDVTGYVTFYEYTENTVGYDAAIDGADFEYLDDNDLWDQIGDPVDTGITGALYAASTSILMGAGLDATDARLDGDFIRAAAYADGVIIGDFDARRYVTGTTMTNEIGDTVTIAGTPTVTETLESVAHTIPFGSVISGIDGMGGYFEAEGNSKPHFSTWFESVNYKSLRIDIAAPTSTDDLLSIDKIWLGFAYCPEYGISYGYTSSQVDKSQHQRKPGGGLETVEDFSYRALAVDFQGLKNSERHVLRNILDRSRKGGDLLLTLDPNDTNSRNYETTSIYRRKSDNGFRAAYYDGNTLGLAVEEN